jgi:hypothetical protein
MVFCTCYNWSVDCWNRGIPRIAGAAGAPENEVLKKECTDLKEGGLGYGYIMVGVAAYILTCHDHCGSAGNAVVAALVAALARRPTARVRGVERDGIDTGWRLWWRC